MRSIRSIACAGTFAVAALLAGAPASFADSNADEDKGLPSESAQQVEALSIADGLVDLGMANRDPLMLVAAAKIVRETPTQQAQRTKETGDIAAGEAAQPEARSGSGGSSLESLLGPSGSASRTMDLDTLLAGGGAAPAPAPAQQPAQAAAPAGTQTRGMPKPETFEDIIAAARSFAEGKPVILAVIDEVAQLPPPPTTRGRVGGPGFTREGIRARSEDVYYITFRGRETATISMRGNGFTDLDLYVYDENGNRICADRQRADRGYCRWVPRWTGNFKVRIVNLGYESNAYVLRTN